ncbi:MAG: hypothetical protein HYW07_20230 [Candidatus Latescibacteria bacterium]|nr:hypothetical protein [Candidatus Latescibacterota bacterium]
MKPKKKKARSSLLARLFGAKGKAEPAAKKAAKAKTAKKAAPEKVAPKPPPPTPLDRSIAEIKQMVRIGQNNPARLATILGNLIKAEQAKKAQADEKYQQLIQDILDRQQQKEQQEPPQ